MPIQPYQGIILNKPDGQFLMKEFLDASFEPSPNVCTRDIGEEGDHSFLLEDDLGYVCRICGVIARGIETIIEFQYAKDTLSDHSWVLGGLAFCLPLKRLGNKRQKTMILFSLDIWDNTICGGNFQHLYRIKGIS